MVFLGRKAFRDLDQQMQRSRMTGSHDLRWSGYKEVRSVLFLFKNGTNTFTATYLEISRGLHGHDAPVLHGDSIFLDTRKRNLRR